MGTARAWCVLAPNPSPMTLDGTNTWVIAEPGSSAAVVVDPGPDDEGHLRRVLDVAARGGPAGDADRADPRAPRPLGGRGPVRRADRRAGRRARPGAPAGQRGIRPRATVLDAGGCELRVVATPGHTADSLSLLLAADGALLTG